MTKLLPLTAALLALSTAAPPDKFTFVDLEPHANQKLTDVFGTLDGNDLKSLRKGERTCASVNFKIGSGVVELHSRLLPNKRPNANATCGSSARRSLSRPVPRSTSSAKNAPPTNLRAARPRNRPISGSTTDC